MNIEPVVYDFRTRLRWTSQKKGVLSCDGKPDLHVACAPEFGGHPQVWTPEDMFVGSVELCTMTTFLYLAEKMHLKIKSYNSDAVGKAKMSEGTLRYVKIEIRPVVNVSEQGDVPKAEKVFDQISRWCLISNSICPEVSIVPDINFQGGDTQPKVNKRSAHKETR